MPVAVAEIAEPAAAGKGLERQRHGDALIPLIARAQLLEQGGEGDLERRPDMDVLGDVDGEILETGCERCRHDGFLFFLMASFGFAACSARSLIRNSCCCQYRS